MIHDKKTTNYLSDTDCLEESTQTIKGLLR